MILVRRLAAAFALVALLSPTAVVCLKAAGHCEQATSSHDCCEGPRLSSCHCGSGPSAWTAEPAKRHTDPVRDLGAVLIAIDAWQPVATLRIASIAFDTSPPPRSGGDRLSLLSILLV